MAKTCRAYTKMSTLMIRLTLETLLNSIVFFCNFGRLIQKVVLLLGLYGMSKNLSLNKIIFWNQSHLDLFMAIILQFHRVIKGYIEKRVKKDNDFEISPFSIL